MQSDAAKLYAAEVYPDMVGRHKGRSEQGRSGPTTYNAQANHEISPMSSSWHCLQLATCLLWCRGPFELSHDFACDQSVRRIPMLALLSCALQAAAKLDKVLQHAFGSEGSKLAQMDDRWAIRQGCLGSQIVAAQEYYILALPHTAAT